MLNKLFNSSKSIAVIWIIFIVLIIMFLPDKNNSYPLFITEQQKQIHFPNWQLADSIYGVENRFTHRWCDIAQN